MSNASSSTSPKEIASSRPSVVPWNPWWGVFFVIIVYYVSQIVSGTLISVYPLLNHWSHTQASDWIENSIFAQFVYILAAEALAIGAIYLFLRRYKIGFAGIGLRRPRWVDLLYGLAAIPLYFLLYLFSVVMVTHFVPSLNVNQQQQLGFSSVHGSAQLILTFISLVILPPLTEEIMIRGFLYSSLKKGMRTIAAVIVTSAVFAAAHLPEGGASGPLYIAALDTFVLSLVLIYLREKTGSLWASITLHAIKNGIAFFFLFIAPLLHLFRFDF